MEKINDTKYLIDEVISSVGFVMFQMDWPGQSLGNFFRWSRISSNN